MSRVKASSSKASFDHEVSNFRSQINAHLDNYYSSRRQAATQISTDYAQLWDFLMASHKAGGKRFRPYLMNLTHRAFKGSQNADILVAIGSAIELLHTAMLIHDDIIDRDKVRHGAPNIVGMYGEYYQKQITTPTDTEHYANAASILAGDLVLSDAYQIVLNSDLNHSAKAAICQLFGDALFNVIGGELLDTEAVLKPASEVNSLAIAEFKTAAYSCSMPMQVGGLLAGLEKVTQLQLYEIGRFAGIAFQLADDLLGTFGEDKHTGKSTSNDLREGKRTYLVQIACERAKPNQKQRLENILGNPDFDEQMAEEARQIIDATGAKHATIDLITNYVQKAKQATKQLGLPEIGEAELLDFIDTLAWRNA